MKIRKATYSDLKVLNEISYASKRHLKYPEEWLIAWKKDLTVTPDDLDQQLIMVIELKNEIVGFAALSEKKENNEIMHFWIKPAYIGKGYGNKLLEYLLSHSNKTNKPIVVESDPFAKGFYERHGFSQIGQVESYPKGRFLPVLKKNIIIHK